MLRQSVETDLEEAHRGFYFDVCRLPVRRRLVARLALKVRRPEVGMVAVPVPAQTDSVVDPLDALEIRLFIWTPDDFEPPRVPRERLFEEHLDVDVDGDDPFFTAPTFSSGLSDVSRNVDNYLAEDTYRDKLGSGEGS